MQWDAATIIGFTALAGGGIGVWVVLNNKITRLETKMEQMELAMHEHKGNVKDAINELKDDLKLMNANLMRILEKLGA